MILSRKKKIVFQKIISSHQKDFFTMGTHIIELSFSKVARKFIENRPFGACGSARAYQIFLTVRNTDIIVLKCLRIYYRQKLRYSFTQSTLGHH